MSPTAAQHQSQSGLHQPILQMGNTDLLIQSHPVVNDRAGITQNKLAHHRPALSICPWLWAPSPALSRDMALLTALVRMASSPSQGITQYPILVVISCLSTSIADWSLLGERNGLHFLLLMLVN